MKRPHYLWCYGRVSSGKQLDGDGERRQQDRDWDGFAAKHGFQVHGEFLFDPGLSAWSEKNWGPQGQLGIFLEKAKIGIEVCPGDCLGCECWDRLWKTSTRRVLKYLLELQDCKIHIADIQKGNIFRYDSDDLMDYLDVLMVTKGGNEGSNTTSERCQQKYDERAAMVKAGQLASINVLPSWLQVTPCDPDEPGAVLFGPLKRRQYGVVGFREPQYSSLRRMIQLAQDGLGPQRIVKVLLAEKQAPMGRKPWSGVPHEKWTGS